MPTISNDHDPYSVYNFWVEWDNIVHAGFQECSGLSLTRNAGTYREGTDTSLGQRQIPGLNTKGNITLKRGMTSNDEMFKWHSAIFGGVTERRNLSIVLTDDVGSEVVRWNLSNCWPTTWTGPDLNATAEDFAIESLELVYEGIAFEKT
ncbi:hypothetical protein Lepto7376_0624 [[Leptolyngbya] sp. PCC 7376]|uniref:phage tail protein n=1 Tax=[Leptolyngbya] sp. PCC 7376 TaxID=111781 RepID=UPI00029F18FD|nr:phage tail protein [[Leptolyngbya] sp. PCC 7376]AFY37036.1 hypothetical protein Lepto7376_0624 [[Leptolyngbya] sp. PCC 7376]